MLVTLRRYVAADAAATLGVFRRAVHVTAAADYSPEQREAWAPGTFDLVGWSEQRNRSSTVVAEIAGCLVGFCDVDAEGYIDMLFVDPDHGRQGVATALVGWVRAEAGQRGATRLTTRASETARPFFEAQGFRVDERLTLTVRGVALTACAMSADLAPS